MWLPLSDESEGDGPTFEINVAEGDSWTRMYRLDPEDPGSWTFDIDGFISGRASAELNVNEFADFVAGPLATADVELSCG